MAEWQTRRTQNPLRATSCGFDSHQRHQTKIIRTIMVRIIFVCTFLFYFFVLLFSSHRIIFEIKNKKEKIKVAVEFFKAPNENAKAFCAYSRAKKTVPRKAVEFVLLPLATKRNSPPKMLAFLEKRSKQVIVSQCLCQQTKDKSAVCDAIRTIMVRIIFVCVLLFYFFVFLFSSRIIFEIKNKKERIKVAVGFFKAPNENANGILRLLSCEESRCKKMSWFYFV